MYPPVSHMMAIQIWARNEENGAAFANYLKAAIERSHFDNAVVIGPAAASIAKIKDEYRMAIYIKMNDLDGLINIRERIEALLEKLTNDGRMTGLVVQFDFDPINGF